MIVKKAEHEETQVEKLLARQRDYGVSNPNGAIFDRIFNRDRTEIELAKIRNAVGQSKKELMYPNGMTPDGQYSNPTIGMNTKTMDVERAKDMQAENIVSHFWKRNRERTIKYRKVAERAEVSESLNAICNEGIYPNEMNEVCDITFHPDTDFGETTKKKLVSKFRMDVLKKLLKFHVEGWNIMRNILVEGRVFMEVIYDKKTNKIVGIEPLPQENMIVIIQEGVIVGYREMLDGQYYKQSLDGKNYIDFSPNQILYADLGSHYHGPGGINDPRSILEYAVKPFNQLNAIEDAIVMYRIQWGNEKMVFKIDTGTMPPSKAEKHMADQSKVLSRKVDYNTSTGEIANYGRVIGLGEHYFLSTSNRTAGSSIERLQGGENLSNIDDLKYFKRQLVNSMHVPPGHVTALAGDGDNFANGKIGEITQSEVAFARMVHRYQHPIAELLMTLYIMVLETDSTLPEETKKEENFIITFKKVNSFQNYIDSEILKNNLDIYDNMVKHVKNDDNKTGTLSSKYAQTYGLKMSPAHQTDNAKWLEEEANGSSAKSQGVAEG